MFNETFIRVLHVDLTLGRVRIYNREDLMAYLGGVGVGTKLLEEYMRSDLPPLSPEQPVVFSVGAASTVFPVITKTAALFISPLTGEFGESYAGGRLALTMVLAGYDAIVITGRAERPSYISIREKLARSRTRAPFGA